MKREPRCRVPYTLREVLQLNLLDMPSLCINAGVIQHSHVTDEQLLSVPGLADTRWYYIRTTHEWIPIFKCVDDAAVIACVDIRPSLSPYDSPDAKWITPKGFPRLQYEEYEINEVTTTL